MNIFCGFVTKRMSSATKKSRTKKKVVYKDDDRFMWFRQKKNLKFHKEVKQQTKQDFVISPKRESQVPRKSQSLLFFAISPRRESWRSQTTKRSFQKTMNVFYGFNQKTISSTGTKCSTTMGVSQPAFRVLGHSTQDLMLCMRFYRSFAPVSPNPINMTLHHRLTKYKSDSIKQRMTAARSSVLLWLAVNLMTAATTSIVLVSVTMSPSNLQFD